MRRLAVLGVLALTACGGHQPSLPHVDAPPRHIFDTPRERLGDPAAPVDEEATDRYLERMLERGRLADPIKEPPPPPPAPYATAPIRLHERYWFLDESGEYRPRPRPPRLPLAGTLLGAGIGAIIGHQSGRRDKGAAIGAGIGLLLDAARR